MTDPNDLRAAADRLAAESSGAPIATPDDYTAAIDALNRLADLHERWDIHRCMGSGRCGLADVYEDEERADATSGEDDE